MESNHPLTEERHGEFRRVARAGAPARKQVFPVAVAPLERAMRQHAAVLRAGQDFGVRL